MTLISVIIPYYKNCDTIFRAINSVYNQTLNNFEVLIINDASPDWIKVEPFMQPLQDKRLRILHHPKNLNGAAARNTGIREAKGQYLAFLDADDEWSPDHLEKSLQFLERTETTDLVFCKFQVKSNLQYTLPNKDLDDTDRLGDYLFVKQQAIFTPSIFLKTNVAKRVLFNEELRRHQDYDFLLRFEAAGFKANMSDHIGGIVHWEISEVTKKGGTWQYSLDWVKEYKLYLSDKAYTNFVMQFIIMKLLDEKRFSKAVSVFLQEVNLFSITSKNLFLLAFPVLKPLVSIRTRFLAKSKKNRLYF